MCGTMLCRSISTWERPFDFGSPSEVLVVRVCVVLPIESEPFVSLSCYSVRYERFVCFGLVVGLPRYPIRDAAAVGVFVPGPACA